MNFKKITALTCSLAETTMAINANASTVNTKNEYKKRNNQYNKKKYYKKLKLEGKSTKKQQLEEVRIKIKRNKKLCIEFINMYRIYKNVLLEVQKLLMVYKFKSYDEEVMGIEKRKNDISYIY